MCIQVSKVSIKIMKIKSQISKMKWENATIQNKIRLNGKKINSKSRINWSTKYDGEKKFEYICNHRKCKWTGHSVTLSAPVPPRPPRRP